VRVLTNVETLLLSLDFRHQDGAIKQGRQGLIRLRRDAMLSNRSLLSVGIPRARFLVCLSRAGADP
jgi:hypothetical protein